MRIFKCGGCAALNAYDILSNVIKTCYTCSGTELIEAGDELPF